MTNDDRRARHDLAHDVSDRNCDVRGLERLKLCRKRSMMRMTHHNRDKQEPRPRFELPNPQAAAGHRLGLFARDREVRGKG